MAMMLLFNHLLRPARPDEAAATDSELRRAGEFLLDITVSILGAVIQARTGSNGGGINNSTPHQLLLLLDISLIAILLSLASSAMHLELHRQLPLPLAGLFLRLAAFFTASAVVLLIIGCIFFSLPWVPFAVSLYTPLLLVCFERLRATPLHYVRTPSRPDEAAETESELRPAGEFLLAITISILGAVIQARTGLNGGGIDGTPHQLRLLLDNSLIAILFSQASSVLHLGLHRQLPLPLARLFLHLAAFFTAAAVVLLITSSISPSLRWVPFAVSLSTLLLLVCFNLFPAILHYVPAALRRYRFAVFLIGTTADDVNVQPPSIQLSPTPAMDHDHETAAPADHLALRIPE